MVKTTNISNHRTLKTNRGSSKKNMAKLMIPKYEVKLAGNGSWNLNQGRPGRPLSPDMLGCPGTEVIGSMVRINGLFHLLINGIFLGVITH